MGPSGYPVIPDASALRRGGGYVGRLIQSNPGNALRGSVITAAGVPVFWFWSSKGKD
jgi:hypothetical protein